MITLHNKTELPKTLFIGLGASPPAWYRCGLPASALEQDWIGTFGGPPGYEGVVIAGNTDDYEIENYEVLVIQQAKGKDWKKFIKKAQSRGQKVLYEIDDFVHGIKKIEDHRFKGSFHKKAIKEYEECMKLCDGMIVSTEFLREQYKKYNPNIFVCENGINTKKYDVEKTKNKFIVIGWAGGTGHSKAIESWLVPIHTILSEYDNTVFCSVGVKFADVLEPYFPGRTISVPWVSIENLPYALTNIDIALAPSHDSKYFKSKSDLRWLEASAVGIPVIASPTTYHDIQDGVTGFYASNENEVLEALDKLVTSEPLRDKIGQQAKEYVQENRDIKVAAVKWSKTLQQIAQ